MVFRSFPVKSGGMPAEKIGGCCKKHCARTLVSAWSGHSRFALWMESLIPIIGKQYLRSLQISHCIRNLSRYSPALSGLSTIQKPAGVVQWQNTSFPSLIRGFDSLHPLQSFKINGLHELLWGGKNRTLMRFYDSGPEVGPPAPRLRPDPVFVLKWKVDWIFGRRVVETIHLPPAIASESILF